MWLFGALKEKVDFLVDEDRMAFAPDQASAGAPAFIPPTPSTASRITSRLRDGPVDHVAPLAFPAA